MLLAVAGSILTSLAACPEAVAAELPMVALASKLNGMLGTVYGLMLLLAMFCNAMASLVGLISYLEQKARFVREKRNRCWRGSACWRGRAVCWASARSSRWCTRCSGI